MYSSAGKALGGFISNLAQPALRGVARRVLPQVMPATEMSGSPAIRDAARQLGVDLGLFDPLKAFPSVVSQQGDNLGILGVRQVPTARELGQAPVPSWGAGASAPTSAAGGAPGVRGVSPLVQNRAPVPLQEAPVPPVRYPEPAPAGQVARQTTMLSPGENEVGSMAARLTYPRGTRGVSGGLGGKTWGGSAEVGAASNYPLVKGPSAQELVEQALRNERVAIEQAGTPLLRTTSADQYVAPVPAWGGSGRGDITASLAGDLYGNGGALVRSPGGQLVEDLIIDPVIVQEIAKSSPEILAGLRNAAGGATLTDLGSLLKNPAVMAGLAAAGIGLGASSVLMNQDPDRGSRDTKRTPAGSASERTAPRGLFSENDGSPLGEQAQTRPSIQPARQVDPTAPGAVTVTDGNLQRPSAVREALAQASPVAAAIQRAVEPMSPERYRNIEDYYAARQAYADSENAKRELIRFAEGLSPTLSSELAQWAEANPALAYELQQRQLVNRAANQQSAETAVVPTATTELGSNTPSNAVGNAASTADAALNPTQGNLDMAAATSPQVKPYLMRMAPRSAMYAGY